MQSTPPGWRRSRRSRLRRAPRVGYAPVCCELASVQGWRFGSSGGGRTSLLSADFLNTCIGVPGQAPAVRRWTAPAMKRPSRRARQFLTRACHARRARSCQTTLRGRANLSTHPLGVSLKSVIFPRPRDLTGCVEPGAMWELLQLPSPECVSQASNGRRAAVAHCAPCPALRCARLRGAPRHGPAR